MATFLDSVDAQLLREISRGYQYRTLATKIVRPDGTPFSVGGIYKRVSSLVERGLVTRIDCPVCGHHRVPILTKEGRRARDRDRPR